MRKIFKLLASLFLFLICVTNYSNGQSVQSNEDYFKIKIYKDYNVDEIITLNSDYGFKINDINNLSIPLLTIDEKVLKLTLDEYGKLGVYNEKGEYIHSLNFDGNDLISAVQGPISIDKKKYRGYLCFLKSDKISIINYVYIEDYLYGVLPKEISPKFSYEAIKAHAIASRSFAIANKNKYIKYGYNLTDNTFSQVYGGYDAEHEICNKAVDETKGMKIYYNGQVCNSVFCSSSGGYTESAENAWGSDLPYLKAKPDIYSQNSPNSTWKYILRKSELIEKLRKAKIDIKDIRYIRCTNFVDGARVKNIIINDGEKDTVISASKLRSILGSVNFKSTYFKIANQSSSANQADEKVPVINEFGVVNLLENSDLSYIDSNGNLNKMKNDKNSESTLYLSSDSKQTIVFDGKGYGHGVGLSQWGAEKMGSMGFSFIDIIKFYFDGVEVR